mmetsp:Transcript_11427/g.31950  ORF Transcript_11427/g.31950 Transcript_11427/m.31950 type:complete len:231 (-) Transcript_11427:210-902(-)|eukprot:CAMPEP_0182618338 /NCGR_PEP_ID=MMETSP1330-20130603/45450_1 /TAXON_ID=464278 /ORGANISM="Picochlorum sp., Strain RCC944" /LENGTH=230 /DNA_ID=CAMNT_0024838559 /DNA_START=76 /DNA_END=768 /DNA_ORIENTATION=+
MSARTGIARAGPRFLEASLSSRNPFRIDTILRRPQMVCASSGDVDAFKGSSVDELRTYLTAHGVDATRWGGQTSSKSLTCLLGEILAGETLIECVDGEPVRRVSVISVEIKNKQGQRLVETEQRLPTGVVRQRHLLLSEKLLPNESWTAASRRGIQEELGSVLPPDARIDVMEDTYEQRTETRLSGSYPGLKTQYQCHKVEARVSGLPDGPFVTTEQRADGLLQSSWSWI